MGNLYLGSNRPPTMKAQDMLTEQNSYDELRCYTLNHKSPAFIHQHVVDAFTAQRADENTKPIAITFALIGLYLHVEKQFSGKQVQRVHMDLAQHKQRWPTFALPDSRGPVSVVQVMAAAEGLERDQLIHEWCVSVWQAYRESRESVVGLVRAHVLARDARTRTSEAHAAQRDRWTP
jgi:hypothetical protein